MSIVLSRKRLLYVEFGSGPGTEQGQNMFADLS